jgi:hypothetical protein
MNFSFFQQSVQPRNYLPDSIYTICEKNEGCTICSNELWSSAINGYVHDPLRGKVFCPFGMGNSMNKPIYGDQSYLVQLNPDRFKETTWGRVPQLDPRPLAKVGLQWRTT